MNRLRLVLWGCLLLAIGGCNLVEVASKSKFGPEWRTKGAGAAKRNSVRWYAQQGVEFKWDKGISTAVTYRRRDEDNGSGGNDNGVWFELSIPLWQHEDHPIWSKDRRIKELEERVARLESTESGVQQ